MVFSSVHCPPLTLLSLVDCSLFTPAIAAATLITGAVDVASATTIATTIATAVTDIVVNATAIDTATAAAAAAAAAGAQTATTGTELIIPNGTEPGILIQRSFVLAKQI